MNRLEELQKKIQETLRIASTNLEDLPSAVHGSWGTAIAQAKDELKALRKEYQSALSSAGVAIFLEGDGAKVTEFAKLIHDEAEGLVVDADALYSRLTDAIEPTLSDARQWGVHQTYRLTTVMQEVMSEVGLTEMPAFAKDQFVVLETRQDVQEHVRKLLRASSGDTLNRLYLEKLATDDALTIGYIGVMAPVAILNAREEEVEGLSRGFAKGSSKVSVEATTEVNKEYLIKTFKEVNKQIRKQTKLDPNSTQQENTK